jgi:hypothetical protein
MEPNTFDRTSEKAVQQLKNKMEDALLGLNWLIVLQENNSAGWNLLFEEAEEFHIDIEKQIQDHRASIMRIGEELLAFEEMKVTYAFKHLEIAIKRLITEAYPYVSIKRFYKWDILIAFLNSRMINVTELENYMEVNELRLINNCIKHSGVITNEIQKIFEFNQSDLLSYSNLGNFYKRVKKTPDVFLMWLAASIYEELYEFNELKLTQLANSFILRMNKETVQEFTRMLLLNY